MTPCRARGIFYSPEEEEPQPIEDMEERFRAMQALEKKRYGTPVFMHQSDIRGFDEAETGGESQSWEMLRKACPLDIDHRVDETIIGDMFQEIVKHPLRLKSREIIRKP